MSRFDAIVIGSGPNGLAAAITLRQQGLDVLLVEGSKTVGGGMRSKELTLPGYLHDVCSAVHPLALGSPFMQGLPLADFGLSFAFSEFPLAHPFEQESAVVLHQNLENMDQELGLDTSGYRHLVGELTENWDALSPDLLGPLRWPQKPLSFARIGIRALKSAAKTAQIFQQERTRGLWAGLVAHGMLPLEYLTTSATGMVLASLAHRVGWPVVRGGSQKLAEAMLSYFQSLGGKVLLDTMVKDVRDLPSREFLVLDITPKQLLQMEGLELTSGYRKRLAAFRYGMGIFKMDWALSEPIPFLDKRCHLASTVHLGGSFAKIAAGERRTHQGLFNDRPYTILAQPSLVDPTRAPAGQHTAWAYCHVPHGSEVDMTAAIESQVERFAPGFRDVLLARSTMSSVAMESYNPNYVGGDINGGQMDLRQLFTRPTLSLVPYRTCDPKVYLASSSTPPGGGVHGLCGFHAARTLMKDHFNRKIVV
ncbi:MAG: phytoene desaturase family protein [Sphingobacterium sp.]